MKSKSIIYSVSDERFKQLVKAAKSFSEILQFFNLSVKGGNGRTLHRRIRELNIDITHIRNNSRILCVSKFAPSQEQMLKAFTINCGLASSTLRRYYRRIGVTSYECAECKLGDMWNNKKIVLQLDHKNGDRSNNDIDNLRWLCPNCHTQTDTYGKKRRGIKEVAKVYKLPEDRPNRRKVVNRPTYEELLELLRQGNYCSVGRKFGVSDNAVRKWLKHYEKKIVSV